MIVLEDEIKYCLAKVTEFTHQYTLTYLGADDPLRSVDNLLTTCETYLQTEIRLKQLAVHKDESAVLAFYVNSQDPKTGKSSFDICYVQGLNHCWTRFVICKELFHVILDKPDYRNMDIGGHIEEVTTSFPDADSEPCNSVAVELLAEVSAMEFLFPYSSRLQELQGELKGNYYAIADKYKVPQVHVERYLSSHYMTILNPKAFT